MLDTIPEELLTAEHETVDIADEHTATQFPELLLVVIPRAIGLNIALNMELLVELLHEDALLESPTGRLAHGVDIPALGYNLILDNARVGDKRIDAIAGHHRHGVTVIDGRSRMRLLLITGGNACT